MLIFWDFMSCHYWVDNVTISFTGLLTCTIGLLNVTSDYTANGPYTLSDTLQAVYILFRYLSNFLSLCIGSSEKPERFDGRLSLYIS